MDIKEFKEKYKPKKSSCIDAFKDKVLELYYDGYAQDKIIKFLEENGTYTTQQNLSRWLRTNSKLSPKNNIENKKVETKPINDEEKEKVKSSKKEPTDEARKAVKDLSAFFKKPIVN